MTDTVLNVQGLSAGYGTMSVLRSVELQVHAGELVGLLGANGAGKTTTLLAISGAIRPTRGSITLAGNDVTTSSIQRRINAGLGFIPDDRALLPSLSVEEGFDLVRHKVHDPYTHFPELEPLRSRRIGDLSGGEQQMVAIARCLSSGPRLILVDELSQGLAPMLVTRIFQALRTAALAEGISVLVVEQQIKECLAMTDRAYVMANGTVKLGGLSADLQQRTNLVASSYLGDNPAIQGDAP